jgi:hypothetical protein
MPTEDRRLQFSAKFDPIHAIGFPTSEPVARVRDVIVCPTFETDTSTDEFGAHPPIGSPSLLGLRPDASEPVDVGRGVILDRLSDEDAELVMSACSPRGHYFAPVRQFGQRFSVIRDVPLDQWQQRPFQWDPEGVLSDVLIMTRIVRDNGYSLQFAARIADFEDGEQTVAYTLAGAGKFGYRLRRDRDWLDPDEGVELRRLLTAFWAIGDGMPDRVRRAIWRTEYASWLPWADLALPVLVGGLESMLKTDRYGATGQFTKRVPALAQELGSDGITGEFCERLYDARSEWVHGTHVRLFSTGQKTQAAEEAPEGPDDAQQWAAVADIARIQDVLRSAVRRCIEDDGFRAIFEDDNLIRDRWPV